MKVLVLLLLLGVPAGALDWSESLAEQAVVFFPPPGSCSPRELFWRPLIAGASISADHKSVSPGMVLARRFGTSRNAAKLAWSGAYGRDTVAQMSDAVLDNATVVVGIDLFYWHGTDAVCGAGEAAVDAFFAKVKAKRKPVVIGNIPLLERHLLDSIIRIPKATQCRGVLNEKIKAACGAYSDCYLVDLERIYLDIQAAGGLTVNGRKYTTGELLPDGRHPGPVCSDYMADRILNVMTRDGARSWVPCGAGAPR